MNGSTRLVEVRTKILKQNDVVAREMRAAFTAAGVYVVSLVSSPGAGKTAFLERTLEWLQARWRAAALVGDLATDLDARRLARAGAPVRQITTGTVCHLEADMVRQSLAGWDWHGLDWLFLENVGNLVCPASFDLGEATRLVLFSVTEGEDKPAKYPSIFQTADAVVLTKMDLASAAEFDRDAALAHLQSVRPGLPVLEVSAKTGQGMDGWFTWLLGRRSQAAAGGGEA